jgi:hypothetical protein
MLSVSVYPARVGESVPPTSCRSSFSFLLSSFRLPLSASSFCRPSFCLLLSSPPRIPIPQTPATKRSNLLTCKRFSVLPRHSNDIEYVSTFRPSSPQLSRLASLFPIFRTLFQLPYPASSLFAALTKTAACHPTIAISELISPSSTPHLVTS